MVDLETQKKLSAMFSPAETRWRIGAMTKDKRKGMALPYIDARDVMNRLDSVIGASGWSDSYIETQSGRVICTITINGISKSDGAGNTAVSGEKGAISDAFKRAAIKWGIGRYLYSIDAPWVQLDERKNILKSERNTIMQCLADLTSKPISVDELVREIANVVSESEDFDSTELFDQWVVNTCGKPWGELNPASVLRIVGYVRKNPISEWDETKQNALLDAKDILSRKPTDGFSS